MARIASTSWVSGGQVTPTRLRLYHILFMIATALAAVAIAAPSVLAQQTVYESTAIVHLDPATFPGLLNGGSPTQPLLDMEAQLGEVLGSRYEGLGSRLRGLTYHIHAPDTIEVVAFTPYVTETVKLTNEASEGLARRIYAGVGTPLLRDILGQQLQDS